MKYLQSPVDGLIGGAALMLLGGLLLLYGFGWATLGTSQLQGLAFWAAVLSDMFLNFPGLLWGWLYLCIFLLGASLALRNVAALRRQ